MRLQFQTHQEQKQEQADLAQRVQPAQSIRREQMRESIRRKAAKKRRPQQYSGRHLTDHARLADAVEEDAEQVCCRQHHPDLENE
jgi:hypothetical protein